MNTAVGWMLLYITLVFGTSLTDAMEPLQVQGAYCGGKYDWTLAPRNAWVISISVPGANSHYVPLTLGSIQSIQNTGSPHDIVVLYDGPHDPQVEAQFRVMNTSFRYIDELSHLNISGLIKHNDHILTVNKEMNKDPNHWRGTWNKIIAFSLTDYDKVVALDPDAIVQVASDELFRYPHVSASPDLTLQTANPGTSNMDDMFNAGLIVAEPNLELATAMMEGAGEWNDWWVGVQAYINHIFHHCYRALPVKYNLRPKNIETTFSMHHKWVHGNVIHHTGRSKQLATFTEEQCNAEYAFCKQCCVHFVKARDQALARVQEALANTQPVDQAEGQQAGQGTEQQQDGQK